ncbi:hypothetical protein [Fundidesulfovibrio putealis]|uniref:hypothetical protein n=1 Tax=Fundidesulfovibrio putealis TaxID=270496 RepID=UPI000405C93C|nr:hypothetical protein [Fundidesulfovibrio putealis]KAF0234871.1 MAG: hypothetical protein FD177_434 [Desulfovibrionaceae bacterium]
MIEYPELVAQRIQAILNAAPENGPIKALAEDALQLLTAPEAYGMAEELAMTEEEREAAYARHQELAWTVQQLKDKLEDLNPEAKIVATFYRTLDNSAECTHFVGLQDGRVVTLLISQDPEDSLTAEIGKE